MLQRFGLYRIKYVEGNQLLCGEVRNIEGPLWWVDLDWTQVPPKPLYCSLPQQDNRGRKYDGKNLWVKIKAV